MITCDAVIDETKTVPTKTVTKKSTFCKVLYVTSFFINYHGIIDSTSW